MTFSPRPHNGTEDNRLRRWIKRRAGAGNYFVMFRPYCRIMSKLDAYFLQDLANLFSMAEEAEDGYFLCTTSYLEAQGWTADEQKDRFASLCGTGRRWDSRTQEGRPSFIRTEKRGAPPRRWVYIDIEAIETALDNYESGPDQSGLNRPHRTGPNAPTSKETPTESLQQGGTRAGGNAAGRDPLPPENYATSNGHARSAPASGNRPKAAPTGTGATPGAKNGSAAIGIPIPASPRDRAPKCRTEQVDHDRAATLRHAIAAVGLPITRTSKAAWADQMAILRRTDGIAETDIDALIQWYANSYKSGLPTGQRIPQVTDAAQFRKCWDWLLRLYRESQVRELRSRPVELTKAQQGILRRLGSLGWPQAAVEVLPAAIAATAAAHRKFCDRIIAAERSGEVKGHTKRMVELFFADTGGTDAFTEWWLEEVYRRNHDWAEWRGDLLGRDLWRPDHQVFTAKMEKVASDYGRPEMWNQLMGILGS